MQRLGDTSENIHNIEWRIINFSRCNIQHGEKLECPTNNSVPTPWKFYIYPNGIDHPGFLSCYVSTEITENSEPLKTEIEFEFSLIASDGKVAFTKSGRGECEGTVSNGFRKFMKLKHILNNKIYMPSDTLTLRCTLRMDGVKSLPTSEIFQTEFSVKKFTTRLNLQDYRCTTKQNPQIFGLEGSKDLLALNVCMDKDGTSQERIQVSTFKGKNSEVRESFLLLFITKNKTKDAVHISCKIKVLSKNMEVVLEKEVRHLFSRINEKENWVLPSFINIKDLPQDCIENDKLLLEAELAICDGKPRSEKVTDLFSIKLKPNSKELKLIKDQEGLLKTRNLSDVILQVDNKSFPVHKSTLAAKSPTFQQIFRSLLKEQTENSQHIVKIDDVSSKTMSLLLKFIYTNQLKEIENFSDRQCLLLYAASQKYQISSLQSKCLSHFRNNLSAKYVYQALMMATSWNDLDLKRVVLDRFAYHHEYILTSPEWDEFIECHEELAYQVLKHIRFKKL